ncbi:hypothetical protein [Moorena sp. SIO4G3]|uniref:hypothetical protein n=1 Tax=Moorena sp. SIO4G3 TaxID=2607821 RepID=UPI00142B531C|nr:hypothetical protein [Moorena sp. SIO4G3]NEO77829.1 hypothetical protein [Moorena sp. SIO4G3]
MVLFCSEQIPGSWVEDLVLRGIRLGNIQQPNLQERRSLRANWHQPSSTPTGLL